MFGRLSVGLVLVFAGIAPTAAARLTPGDLLVLDASNQKILHVDVATGAVDDFAPRGGGSNLIAVPRGIASSPEGEVYVTNYVDGTLVRIDATSGAQPVLEFFSSGTGGPLDLGTHPAGVAVSPAAPAANSSRDVYVSSQGAMFRVQQDFFSTMPARVAYPLGYESTDGMYLSTFASGVVQAYIFATPSVLIFNGSTIDSVVNNVQDQIYGFEWAPFVPFMSRVAAPCPSSSNGVANIGFDMFLGYTAQDYATGGDLACPGALTATPQDMVPFAFYVIDEGSNPPRIVRFDSAGAPPTTSLVATLPAAAIYPDMAVYVPEPDAGSTGEVALAELGALAVLLRRPRCDVSRRRTPSA